MQYRTLGPSGVQVSALSFGCGRLPQDDEESTRVIHAAIAAGCNYFETATFYCDGRCQQKTALGIRGLRDKIMVSAKQGIELDATADSYRKGMEEQFTTLGVDYVDWMQVGWLSLERLPILTKKGGPLEAIHKAMDEGIVKHIGFTGHDTPENFIEILKTGIFESMTVSYNLLNRAYEPAIAVARELGVGVIVMNPVGGGMLGTPSEKLQGLIPGGAVTSSADLALHYVLSNPGVSTACSGMNSVEMVQQNLHSIEHPWSEEDQQQAFAVLEQFKALGERFCTGCRYCAPCPQGVEIDKCFNLYNLYTIYDLREAAARAYSELKENQRASACIRCGACEDKCPNKLPVMDQLEKVRGLFEVDLVR